MLNNEYKTKVMKELENIKICGNASKNDFVKKVKDNMNYGLTVDEKEQLIALLDKIKTNHCKNYHGSCFGWSCANKSDNEVCPIEYEVYSETELEECGGFFYCPLFVIRNILEEENEN